MKAKITDGFIEIEYKEKGVKKILLITPRQIVQQRNAIKSALDNIGVPQPGYPAPIAEAYRILATAVSRPTPFAPDAASAAHPKASA